jgi:hypothetical protein
MDRPDCLRTPPPLLACSTCGATPLEECPFADLTPGLLESHPITAGTSSSCTPDDPACESCQ